MELLKHEIYKIFSKRNLYVSLLIMLIVVHLPMTLSLSNQFKKDFHSSREVQEYIKSYEGKVNSYKEVVDELLNKIQVDKDKNKIYNFILGEYTSQGKPRLAAISDVVQKTKNPFRDVDGRLDGGVHDFEAYELKDLSNNIELLEKQKKINTYEYRNKVLANNMYQKVSIPKVYYNEGWWRAIWEMNAITPFLIAAMILLGISPIFAGEYESRTSSIMLSTKNGRSKIMKAKILAAIIYTIAIVCVVNLIGLATMISIFGVEGTNAPMQCLFDYRCSPYNFTILQFWGVAMLTSAVGYIIFTLIIILISNLSKSSLKTFFVGAFIFSVPIIIEKLVVTSASWSKAIINLSVNQFIKGTNIYKVFYTVGIFRKPIIYPIFELGYGIAIICLLYIMIRNSIDNGKILK